MSALEVLKAELIIAHNQLEEVTIRVEELERRIDYIKSGDFLPVKTIEVP